MIISGEEFLDPPNVVKLRFYSVLGFQLPSGINPMVFEQKFLSMDRDPIIIKIHPSLMFFYCMYCWEAY